MIGKLKGTFDGTTPENAVLIDVNGVGYCVRVPLASALSMQGGQPVSLFIHTAVREDAIDLYGFLSEEELSFFKLLTSVSGVGPKTAIGILNVSDIKSLKRAIAQGDNSALTKVFGIGKKSAERIVVELRDKLAGEKDSGAPVGPDGEVIEALMALGYRADESRQALKGLDVKLVGVKERLSAALKTLGRASA
ncbi:Holliday junction branch migration protein RuvA [Candidatus Parcubacteria bacterium]|nr:Holliday junction branch migration protein RuvA [Candidatus Parcubacteria bacterium]